MRTNWATLTILLLTIWLANSCIEKFSPDIDDYDNMLVVDGLITNQEGPYQVVLSKTSPVDDTTFRPFQEAFVRVEDSNGNIYTFNEIKPGTYQNNSFTGVPGTSYKLHIATPDNKNYETSFIEMPNQLPIDTVYYQIETKATTDPGYDEIGCRFYIATHDPDNNQMYFLWKLDETWEFHADYPMEYIYNGYIEPYPNPFEFYTCWRSNKLSEFFLEDASLLSNVNLQNIPLNYVNTESKRLTVRYSLLVSQYTIKEGAYDFFSSIQEMNSGDDLFHSTQPYQIKGNLECITNPEESVLGYFLVAGKTEKRIFVNGPLDIPYYYSQCVVNTQGLPYIGNYSRLLWPIYIATNDAGEMGIVGKGCVDCREKGGSLERPDFW